MATTNWGRLTVVDLRHELKQRGLSTVGKKADLVERLTTAENDEINNASPANDHGTEAQMPIDTSEAISNDVKDQENMPEAGNGVADKLASIEMSQLGEKSEERIENMELAAEPETIEKSEPVIEPDTVENPHPTEDSGSVTKSESAGEPELITKMEPQPVDSTPTQLAVSTMEVDDAPPDLSRDVRGRKRRSRTPPPSDDESARKRTRPEQHTTDKNQSAEDPTLVGEEVFPLDDDPSGKDSSYAKLLPDIPTESRGQEASHGGLGVSSSKDSEKIEPSLHPPTSALYIRNLMRPLREEDVHKWLAKHATRKGRAPDGNIIKSFFLDKIRSHVFVEFDNVTAAESARAKIHAKIWPEESTRKALWADFIPPERISNWVDIEKTAYSRGDLARRWELIYEEEEDGKVKLELIDRNDPKNNPRLMGRPEVVNPTGNIKTGRASSQQFPGVEGAPSGPRGHSFGGAPAGGSGSATITKTAPCITFTPVSDYVVRQRLHNLRNTQKRNRSGGKEPPQDLFWYSFDNNDTIINCGDERFPPIRRPIQSGRRNRNQYRPRPPRPHGGDRYAGGGRDRFPERDVPRSRFDNTPLPTFRGGGGGLGGPRRPPFWNHRY